MQIAATTYVGSKLATKLITAVLALAGSSTMIGGNLIIATYYGANAGIAQPMAASRGDSPRQIALSKCTNNAS